ncbi:hypothetical protein CB225_23065 [Salmonella enterica subsp. enterica serovar Newport]|nr:hypothetical protein [Salmonella enterica subsp. enterica serovar Newport]
MMKLNMIQMKKVFLPVLLLSGLAGSTGVRAEVPAGGSSIPGSNVAVGLSGEVVRGTCSVTVTDPNFSFGVFHVNSSTTNQEQELSRDIAFTITGCKGQYISMSVKASTPTVQVGAEKGGWALLTPPADGKPCSDSGSKEAPFRYGVIPKLPDLNSNRFDLQYGRKKTLQPNSDPYTFMLRTTVVFSGKGFLNTCGPDGNTIYGTYKGNYTYDLTYY